MARRHFSERDVLETLLRTGHKLFCFRSHEPITLDNVRTVEREHVTPIALGGADNPTNCAYSFRSAHKVQSFGGGATTADSDIGKIAKTKRIAKGKMAVNKPQPGEPKTAPKRKSSGFAPGHRPMRNWNTLRKK
jgi:hypothetical protein